MLAYDVDFNREVVQEAGRYFRDAAGVAALLENAERDPATVALEGKRSAELAERYNWDDVADGYEELAHRLAARRFPARRPSGRRGGRPSQEPAVVAP